PELTPVVYSNNFTNGTIPRRIPYQSSEKTANATNYNAAVALLSGGDNYTSRMWWDVAQ
ncbi:MAG: SusD/RagB family nutrient-binding outer rane lipoprotein, partial [Bacteroidetes bacterium]|nr:SusD/RagB family nutrient-binding outer rane lipoprotein [Bacteroidota bacterium]